MAATYLCETAGHLAATVIAVSQGIIIYGGFTMLPATAISSTAFPAAVAADNPVLWYELNETSGTVAYDSSSSPHNGVYQGGVALGEPGPITDCVTLDGSSAYISNANVGTSPSSFSIDIWFKTTTIDGGLIIGFGNSVTGASSNCDRHIYMGTSGQLYFGVAFNHSIHSTEAYNDGLWHEATATIGSAGMFLYVDGSLVASSMSTTASAQTYSGSWRVGYNGIGGWSAHVNCNYFAGSVSQASVYDYQLTATQVAAHYAAAVKPLALTDSVVPAGEVGADYRYPLTAAGGTVPYTWSVGYGTLPAGITLDATTGELSGTPTAAGTFAFTIRVTDAAGQAATRATSLLIVSGLALSSDAPPAAEAGRAYRCALATAGGTAPFRWEVSDGDLPGGITLDPATGVLSGAPATAGTATFTVRVSDAKDRTATQAASLTVAPPALGFPVPPGEAGAAYHHELSVAGGTAPYEWHVTGGDLPDGITLAPVTGTLAGTPAVAGSYHFTVLVTDAEGQAITRPTSLTVVAAPAIPEPATPAAEAGAAYHHELSVTGGTAPYEWHVTGGDLPDGITLAPATGTLAGVPMQTGRYQVTVQVADASDRTATQELSLFVASPALSFPVPPGEAGAAYHHELSVTGGTAPYEWHVTGGDLPDGITLAPATGTLAGVPTEAGRYYFSVTVTDSADQSAVQHANLIIGAP
jgi:Putative Ig domain/Concanavalin A-like lectin/glucanases superfamily